MLSIKGLTVRLGQSEVLRGIDLHVADNEMVALIGPNGSGKTTLLKTIAGLVTSTGGEITYSGSAITNVTMAERVRKGITLVPQGRRLFGGMTVEENIKLGAYARRHNSAEIATDLESWLGFFDKHKVRNKLARNLSGGEQQMIAIARGLMARPSLLLLDEPSIGIAPIVLDELRNLLGRLRDERHLTMILVEQNIPLALAVASRVAVLSQGKIVLEDDSHNLRNEARLAQVYFGGEP